MPPPPPGNQDEQDPRPAEYGEDVFLEQIPAELRAELEATWAKATGPMVRACEPAVQQIQKMSVAFEPIKRDMEVYAGVPRRMTSWQKKHWRDLTLREIKQRLDAEDQRRQYADAARRGARRRPVMVGARPREQRRSRSRVTRAGPSDDPDHDLDPPLARGRLEVA
jgi:hypothetical protein